MRGYARRTSVPEDGVSLQAALQYILSPSATSLRSILQQEALNAADLLIRQVSGPKAS
jgi:hypothetical protein